jgi:hypothetical protein
MPRKSLRLTKATVRSICKHFHLLPSQVYEAEIVSLRHRLEDAQQKKTRLLKQIDSTTDRQILQQLRRTELPKTERLIHRFTNEITKARNQISRSIEEHLHQVNPSVYPAPGTRPKTD